MKGRLIIEPGFESGSNSCSGCEYDRPFKQACYFYRTPSELINNAFYNIRYRSCKNSETDKSRESYIPGGVEPIHPWPCGGATELTDDRGVDEYAFPSDEELLKMYGHLLANKEIRAVSCWNTESNGWVSIKDWKFVQGGKCIVSDSTHGVHTARMNGGDFSVSIIGSPFDVVLKNVEYCQHIQPLPSNKP